ncbi:MAG: ATP-binding protein [archaeon]
MILGKIIGKLSTTDFKFEVKDRARKFDYIQVIHNKGFYVLAQIIEIEKDNECTIAKCKVIGYRNKENRLCGLKFPLEPNSEVLKADDEFVKVILGLEEKNNYAYFGSLEGRDDLKVYLDLNKLLTKHVAVLAKSGSGKSYNVGVILEELLERKVPMVIIDPHGEYSTLQFPNPKDKEKLILLDIEPKGFKEQIVEYSPDLKNNSQAKPLKLSNKNLTTNELINLLPAKLSNAQLGTLYSAFKNLGSNIDFNDLIFELEGMEDNPSKWTLINILEYLKKLNLFSQNPTLMCELVKPGKASIINLKGVAPEVQQVVVYKIVNDLFMERKKGNIAPFFLVIEEAQNFCPERSFGEAKSSAILRQVLSEGRKFGLGVGIISQRPARVDKNILSQCSTQIILKVTNPNDIKAISNSVEGITSEAEKEIQNIPIGTAMVTGVVDLPLFVNVRPRKSKHGGEAVQIFVQNEETNSFVDNVEDFAANTELLPVIKQKTTLQDIKLMNENCKIKTKLIPCALMFCSQKNEEFNILINLENADIITNIENCSGTSLKDKNMPELSPQQTRILNIAIKLGEFKASDLFGRSGVQFSELYDLIKILTTKGYFVKDGETYKVSDNLHFFSNLNEYATYENSDYMQTSYDEKNNKKIDTDKVKEFLSNFCDIKNMKECYLEYFEVNAIPENQENQYHQEDSLSQDEQPSNHPDLSNNE